MKKMNQNPRLEKIRRTTKILARRDLRGIHSDELSERIRGQARLLGTFLSDYVDSEEPPIPVIEALWEAIAEVLLLLDETGDPELFEVIQNLHEQVDAVGGCYPWQGEVR